MIFDGVSSFDVKDDDRACNSFIELSEINVHEQRGTAVVRFCGKQDLNAGERYEPKNDPPGYKTGQGNRGHLIGSNFHGSGVDENIVAIYETTNKSSMAKVERQTAKHLRADREVIYVVTPLYEKEKERPWAVHMSGIASGGTTWDHCIPNNGKRYSDGGRVDGSFCR